MKFEKHDSHNKISSRKFWFPYKLIDGERNNIFTKERDEIGIDPNNSQSKEPDG
jgi:hypothetical protein